MIPAYQAAGTLPGLLAGLARALPALPVLVVDDGSADATAAVSRRTGAGVIVHPRNLGKGAALRTGFAAALERGASGVVTLDADGQHPPALVGRFLEAARTADLVVGCRMRRPGGMPWARRQANRATSRAVSWLARRPLKDSQCGYRWISAAVLGSVALRADRYETESELLILAARAGFRIAEIEIPAVYAGETSHIRSGADTLRFVRMVARFV